MTAKRFHTVVLRKAPDDGTGTGSIQNFLHTLRVKVAQRHNALSVQTAWHDRTVAQNADLILKPVAAAPLAVIGCAGQRRPIKALAPFQIQTVAKLVAVRMRDPLLGEGLVQSGENGTVILVMSRLTAAAVQIP